MCWYAEDTAAIGGGIDRSLRICVAVLCALVGCAGVLVGCSNDHGCTREICDGLDNDCDGNSDEDFVGRTGLYTSAEHCGSCGLRCADVFPTALRTESAVLDGAPRCRITRCADDEVMAGDGACVPKTPVLCLPCASDDDCALRSQDARCLREDSGALRCGQPCVVSDDCPTGFGCTAGREGAPQCQPLSGACACDESMMGADFACELVSPDSNHVCAGVQRCTASGLSDCESVLPERCNSEDDDCDGKTDEDFVDERGRYVSDEHCGACGQPCVAQGPHMVARCESVRSAERCTTDCETGFVDVNGLAADGCECEINSARAPLVGGDQDCDGEIDPIPELVFVSQTGDDRNSGLAPDAPVRSIARGLALGATYGRSVLIARGIYQGQVSLLSGVTIVGGYSPDFHEHDPELYPVLLEAPGADPGAPVLRAIDIDRPTYLAGVTVAASAGLRPGQGSTAVLIAGSTSELELQDVTVLAARGAAGARGADSSDRLAERGLNSLADLSGLNGGSGEPGGFSCNVVAAGRGGVKSCGTTDVSGGDGGAAQCAAISCQNGSPCGNAGCTDFTTDGRCDLSAVLRAAVANPSAQDGRGVAPGRAAEATYDAPTNHGSCSFCDDNPSLARFGGTGTDGRTGTAGVAGPGCSAGLDLDPDGRVQARGGAWGGDGSDGSGGGGGTAGAGYAVIGGTSGVCSSVAGGAGGGAGSGGCGAPGAAGGGGGGVSAGIVIILPSLLTNGPLLSDVRVVTASGGDGGDGGVGALGGAGGSGGVGGASSFWCARNGGRGGDGGMGGSGGGGGGGCGGSSIGIYLAPNADSLAQYAQSLAVTTQIEIAGAAGRGGRGGFSPGNAGSSGADGMAVAISIGRP